MASRDSSEGFFCDGVCDECGATIERGEWHTHDNETEESFCPGCRELPEEIADE